MTFLRNGLTMTRTPCVTPWSFVLISLVIVQLVSLGSTVDVRKDCGAYGDGVTDDSAAFQKCIYRAQVSGPVNVPTGRYLITSTLWVNSVR